MTATFPVVTRTTSSRTGTTDASARKTAPSSDGTNLIIIEPSALRQGAGFAAPRDPNRPSERPRTAHVLDRIAAGIGLTILGIAGAAFTAVWVVVTILANAVGLGRSGRLLRPAPSSPSSHTD